nr:flippase activity-associated protein Agl23 [Methanomicrobium sp. W14]
MLLLFVIALLLRFLFLDLKLLHHDESIHAWFSLRLLEYGTYSYDPTYHGPFLYYVTAGVFSLLGASDLTTRIVPSLLGSLVILLVYPIYKLGYLDRAQTIIVALFLAISPDMVYFSRFLRNDIFIVFFTLVLLIALLYYIERKELKYAVLAAVAAGLSMSCKENVPIIILIFGIYLLYIVLKKKFVLPKRWILHLAVFVFVTAGIMAAFYSSFGMQPEVLLNGPYDALSHWIAMHEEQRLGGPFYFYIILFLLYELPIFILAVSGVLDFVRFKTKKSELLADDFFEEPEVSVEPAEYVSSDLLASGELNEDTGEGPKTGVDRAEEASLTYPAEAVDTVDKESSPGCVADSLCESVLNKKKDPSEPKPVNTKNREFTRFCIFWMLTSLVVYAYIGEKVPWLILHQLLPMIFVSVYCLRRWKIWLTCAGVLFLIVMTMHVAFTPADISEPIVQVQNSEDLRDVMKYMDSAQHVVLGNDVEWPFVWYYMQKSSPELTYYGDSGYDSDVGPENFDVIILHDTESVDEIPGFTKYTYKRGYWINVYGLIKSPSAGGSVTGAGYWEIVFDDMKKLVSYYFTRNTDLGSLNIDVFVKNNTSVQ